MDFSLGRQPTDPVKALPDHDIRQSRRVLEFLNSDLCNRFVLAFSHLHDQIPKSSETENDDGQNYANGGLRTKYVRVSVFGGDHRLVVAVFKV